MTDLPTAARRIAIKAHDLGWLVDHNTVTNHVEALLLEADGKTGQKGEVRTPEHDEDSLFMFARHPLGKVGFLATWTDGKFTDAHIADPLGIPVELHADYKMDARYAKTLGYSPAEVKGLEEQRDRNYNDGAGWSPQRTYTKKATVLTDWLNQWLAIVNPAKAPKSRKPKTEAEPDLFPEAGLTEWSSE